MEVCRLRKFPLRLSPSPFLSFLAPAASSAWRPTLLPHLSCFAPGHGRRFVSDKTSHNVQNPTANEESRNRSESRGALAKIVEQSQINRPRSAVSRKTLHIRDTKLQSKIHAKLDQMFPSKTGQSPTSSADDVLDAYHASTTMNHSGLKPGSIAGRMLMPSNDSSSSTQGQLVARTLADMKAGARRNKRTVRSRPAVGRTIEVEPAHGVDFGMAIRRLTTLLSKNKVKTDLRRQKYHERAGAKRKRLKSERWRKYFKAGFKATLVRVQKMRRQGW